MLRGMLFLVFCLQRYTLLFIYSRIAPEIFQNPPKIAPTPPQAKRRKSVTIHQKLKTTNYTNYTKLFSTDNHSRRLKNSCNSRNSWLIIIPTKLECNSRNSWLIIIRPKLECNSCNSWLIIIRTKLECNSRNSWRKKRGYVRSSDIPSGGEDECYFIKYFLPFTMLMPRCIFWRRWPARL